MVFLLWKEGEDGEISLPLCLSFDTSFILIGLLLGLF
jgi:hypothetical protein